MTNGNCNGNGNGKKPGKLHFTKDRNGKRPSWQEIEARYVTSERLTLRELEVETGYSLRMLANKSRKGEWPAKREAYFNKVAASVQQSREAAKAQRILTKLEFDAVTENVSDMALGLVGIGLEKVLDNHSTFDAMEIKELMTVAEKAQNLKYRALNIGPPKTTIEIQRTDSPLDDVRKTIAELSDKYDLGLLIDGETGLVVAKGDEE